MKSHVILCTLATALFLSANLHAQAAQQRPQPQPQQHEGVVVEEIIARVNNDIITRADVEHARQSMISEVREGCNGCSQQQIDDQITEKSKNLLRDLIDQSLLVQRAQDADIKVDTEVIKRLDEIRQENHLADLDALEREVTKSGQDYEDFKEQIRNQLLTQEIIRREAGEHVVVGHDEVAKYYEDHKSDFVRPETVVLREIFVSTENKSGADIPVLRKKADGLRDRVLKNGDDFGEMAKHFSDSSTAQQNGDLGTFERTQLDPKIADKVFALKRGDLTDVIETKTGFEVLQVQEHYDAGQQPLDKVEGEITSKLYDQKMEPALREYLKMLREDSYVIVKPGYTDTAAVENQPIQEVAANSDKPDAPKKAGHRLLVFPKKNSGT